jgi:hypothetical protein
MNNKRAHAEKRRSGDYNKISHDFLGLMVQTREQ